jgi:hypothetical protein
MAYAYAVRMENQTVSATATLILVRPSATVGFRVRRIQVTQGGSATSTAIRLQWGRKASAFGTYTSATPGKMDEKDAISGIVGGTSGAAGTTGTLATSEGAGTFTALGSPRSTT